MAHEKKQRSKHYLNEVPVEKIAKALSVSQSRIHQIERGALRKIREGLGSVDISLLTRYLPAFF